MKSKSAIRSDIQLTKEVFPDYASCYERFIAPLRAMNLKWKRLDGQRSGGNPTPMVRFKYAGKTWWINADTRFDILHTLYVHIKRGHNVFETKPTKNLLALKPVKMLGGNQRGVCCFIYGTKKI